MLHNWYLEYNKYSLDDIVCYLVYFLREKKLCCPPKILPGSSSYSPSGSINTKIFEIGVVGHLSSKILGHGPEQPKSMYFLCFLWKLTNFGSQFLHNRCSDLSQILNLSSRPISSWPKKISGQSVHVRARKNKKRARQFSKCRCLY